MADDDMKIKVRSVFDLVLTLQEQNKIEPFIQEMESRGVFVVVTMNTINAVKEFFVANGLHSSTAFGQTIGITVDAATRGADPGCQDGHCGHTYGF
jgi:hypothetical protein